MRKIVCGIFVLLGVCIIGIGVFLQFSNINEKEKKEDDETLIFERLNNFDGEEVCSTYETISTYINTNTYDKISFDYPDCVHEYTLSYWSKIFENEDSTIRIFVNKEVNTLDNYMNKTKTRIVSEKNEKYHKNYIYSDVYKLTTKSGIEVQMIEVNYLTEVFEGFGTNNDLWYVAAKIDDKNILTYEIIVKNAVMSYKSIEEMFNSLKIEEDAATFTNTKKDGDYQVGSIRQNKYKSYNHGYRINLKVSNKYPEVDSFTSNYDESVFEYEDIDKSIYVTLSITKDNYKTFEEKIDSSHRIALSTYDDETHYRNRIDSGIRTTTLNDKEISYYMFSHDYYLKDEKTSTYYRADIFYQISDGYYYEIYISNKNEKIDETFISEFLNFTVEEY